jgi:hypothetical protein
MLEFDLQSAAVASQPVLQYQLQVQGSIPPPSYQSIPGTMPAHVSSDQAAPPSYEEASDANGTFFDTLCNYCTSLDPYHCFEFF